MKPQVEIYDTTLRDGSQGEGINFSVADKLRIAEKLDSFGVHYIEGGWPGSNPKDIEFFAQAKKRKFKNAKLAAFGSTRKKNTPVEQDDQVRLLIEAETPVVTIYGKTSLLHVKEVLRASPDENLAMIGDTIRYLKDHGKFVIYDAEHSFDGYSDEPDYALATWQAAEKAGSFDVDKVREAVIGEKFKGPAGEVTMQENHHLVNNVYIGETLPSGQFKIIKTFAAVAAEPFSEKFLK